MNSLSDVFNSKGFEATLAMIGVLAATGWLVDLVPAFIVATVLTVTISVIITILEAMTGKGRRRYRARGNTIAVKILSI